MNNDLHETIETPTHKLEIIIDTDPPESPREWDNFGTMVCFHSRYTLGDEHDFDGPGDVVAEKLTAAERKQNFIDYGDEEPDTHADSIDEDNDFILPLYLYDHSGITMSTGPFSCRFDSGQVGYIFVRRADVLKSFGWKRISKKRAARVYECLEHEVKIYDQYLTGDVYGFQLYERTKCKDCIIKGALPCTQCKGEDTDKGDDGYKETGSCWGFYGDNIKENGMLDHLDVTKEERAALEEAA